MEEELADLRSAPANFQLQHKKHPYQPLSRHKGADGRRESLSVTTHELFINTARFLPLVVIVSYRVTLSLFLGQYESLEAFGDVLLTFKSVHRGLTWIKVIVQQF